MNNNRRKEIKKIIYKLNYIEEEINDISTDIDTVCDEEQDSLDNIPENLQGSFRYQISEEAVNCLENARDNMQTISDLLSDTLEYLSAID